jgi:uroporphyrinogen-III synthase
MGFEPLVAPVLQAQPIAGATIDLVGVEALAFTSAHAVAAFAALTGARALPVFAVGETCAEQARKAGFACVVSAAGDVSDLADLVAAAKPRPARVLNPSARAPAADFVDLLAARGVLGRVAAVYETIETGAAPALDQIDAILIHSSRAARALAVLLLGRPEAAHIDGFAISPAAAQPLIRVALRSLSVADRPDEAALLRLLMS